MTTLQLLDETISIISGLQLDSLQENGISLKEKQEELFTKLTLQRRIPKELIKEVYQLIKGDINEEELFTKLKHNGNLVYISHYGLDMKTYAELLAYTKLAAFYEGTAKPEVDAYKLAKLWGDKNTALKYLEINFKENVNSSRQMQDACLYNLPAEDNWDVDIWRKLFEKNMLKTDFIKSGVLANASAIQQAMITEKPIEVKKGKITEIVQKAEVALRYDEATLRKIETCKVAIEELKEKGKDYAKQVGGLNQDIQDAIPEGKKQEMSHLTHELKQEKAKLKKNPSLAETIKIKEEKLTELNEEINKIEKIIELKVKLEELMKASKGVKDELRKEENQLLALIKSNPLLENIDYKVLIQELLELTYTNASENRGAAELFHKYGITQEIFEDYLALSNQAKNSDEMIPSVVIDGKQCGCAGYYMIKLKKNDPKGPILGYITGCCQSLKSNGDACARHGVTSEMGGFYVLCKGNPPKDGDTTKIAPKDIIAQSWTWRAEDDSIVFDSIESQPNIRAIPENVAIMRKMYHTLGIELTQKHDIESVKVGVGGYAATPVVIGYQSEASIPLDHPGYQDSEEQRELASSEYPLYAKFYINFDNAYQEFLHLPEEEKEKYDPKLIEDIFLRLANPEQMSHLFQEMKKKNIDIKQYINDNNCLFTCAKYGNASLISYLVQQGADIDKPNHDDYDYNPLHMAVFYDHAKVVEELLKNNANIHKKNEGNDTAIGVYFLRRSGNPKVWKPLLDAYRRDIAEPLDSQDEAVNELLRNAIRVGYNTMARDLIKKGADINAKDAGVPVLCSTLRAKNNEIAKVLLKKNADIFATYNGALGIQAGYINALEIADYERNPLLLEMLKNWEKRAYKENTINRQDHLGRTLLMWAVKASDRALIKRLLQKGADITIMDKKGKVVMDYLKDKPELLELFFEARPELINTPNPNGETPLIASATSGKNKLVKEFLSKGADIHHKDALGRSPLLYAAGYGHKEVVETLLANNADLFDADNENMTALDWPLKNMSYKPVADVLLDAWFEKINTDVLPVNKTDKNNKTLLMWAVIYNREDLVDRLLEKEADVHTLKDKTGKTALDYARSPLLKKLVKHFGAQKSEEIDHNGKTPLMWAAQSGDHELLEKLLQSGGFDINAKDMKGRSALSYACENAKADSVKALLMQGADPQDLDTDGKSMYFYALRSSESLDIIFALIEHGFNCNHLQPDGTSLLQMAVRDGDFELTSLLLSKGADIHYANSRGDTALHDAVRGDNQDIVNILLRYGADPLVRNSENQSASDVQALFHPENDYLLFQWMNIWLERINENPTLMDIPDIYGRTLLSFAAEYGQREIVEKLLNMNADFTKEDEYGYAALEWATQYGHIDCIDLLIAKGADLKHTNKSGWTPLHIAAYGGDIELVNHLLSIKPAIVNMENNEGQTALFSILDQKNLEMIKVFLDHGAKVDETIIEYASQLLESSKTPMQADDDGSVGKEEVDDLVASDIEILQEIHDLLLAKYKEDLQNNVKEDKPAVRKAMIYSSMDKEKQEKMKSDLGESNPKKQKKFTN